MVVPWIDIPDRKWAKVGKSIAAHEFCKWLINENFMRKLHKRMLGDIWMWAGEFRKSNKNIGVPRESIGIELHKLCEDAKYWVEFESYSIDEIAARFHHRLVWVHPFVNGNGRHARLMSDLLLEKKLGGIPFTWGRGDINQMNNCRQKYIQALRTADKGDYTLLLDFVRS